MSEETPHRSSDDAVQFEPLGAVDLKGIATPLPLYRALRK